MNIPDLNKNFELVEVENNCYVLKNLTKRKYLELTEKEYFIFQNIDGKNGIEEISNAFFEKFSFLGQKLIYELLSKLFNIGVLSEKPPVYIEKSKEINYFPVLKLIFSINLDKLSLLFEKLPLKIFFHRFFFYIYLISGLAGLAIFYHSFTKENFHLVDLNRYGYANLWDIISIFYLIHLLRVFAFTQSLLAHRREIIDFSLNFFIFIPYLNFKKDDLLLSKKWERIRIQLSGFVFHLFITGIISILAYFAQVKLFTGYQLHLAQKFCVISYIYLFFQLSTLYPSDLLKSITLVFSIHDLKARVLQYIKVIFKNKKGSDRNELILSVLLSLTIIWIIYFFHTTSFLLSLDSFLLIKMIFDSNLLLLKILAFSVMAIILIPPFYLILYALVMGEKKLIAKSNRDPFYFIFIIFQPVAISYLINSPKINFYLFIIFELFIFGSLLYFSIKNGFFEKTFSRLLLITITFILISGSLVFASKISFKNEQLQLLETLCCIFLSTAFFINSITGIKASLNSKNFIFYFSMFLASFLMVLQTLAFDKIPIFVPYVAQILVMLGFSNFIDSLKGHTTTGLTVSIQGDNFKEFTLLDLIKERFIYALNENIKLIFGQVLNNSEEPLEIFKKIEQIIGTNLSLYFFNKILSDFAVYDRTLLEEKILSSDLLIPAEKLNLKEDGLKRLLETIPLFKELSDTELNLMLRFIKLKKFKKNSFIITEGEQGDRFYAIKAGKLAIYKKDDFNFDVFTGTLMEGDCFGEIALLHEVKRTASIMAETECELLFLEKQHFNWLIKNYPVLKGRITNILSKAEILRNVSIFSIMESSRIFELASYAKRVELSENSIVIKEGESGETFYVIVEGEVEVLKNGKKIKTLFKNNFFGELALIKNQPRNATILSKNNVVLLEISKSNFLSSIFSDKSTTKKINELSNERNN